VGLGLGLGPGPQGHAVPGVWGGSNGPTRMVFIVIDRQQSLLKAVLKKIIKAFLIRGKAQMKQALVVSQEVKNDTFFLGFTASQ